MPISLQCTGCGTKLKAPDSAAGKVLNCPRCGESVKVRANVDSVPDQQGLEASVLSATPERSVLSQATLKGNNENDPVTIQRTAKRWKLLTAIGTVLILVGLAVLVIGISTLSLNPDGVIHANADTWFSAVLWIGFPILLIGLGIRMYAALMAWWHHG